MATLLHRLGTTAFRRWPFFLAAWLVVLVAMGGLAASVQKPMSDAFSIPGIPSEKAAGLQSELFPDAPAADEGASANVVVAAPEGQTLSDPTYAAAVGELVGRLQQLPQLLPGQQLADPVTAAAAQEQLLVQASTAQGVPADVAQANADALSPLSSDGRIGTITVAFDVANPTELEPATLDDLTAALDDARDTGLTAEANGTALSGQVEIDGTSEIVGIAVALLVLLLTFGSLVAAGLPILSALVGVGIGVLGIFASTAVFDIGTTTPLLATMIGLAVGIDYTLFILARYRDELRGTEQPTRADRERAVGMAVGTAGSAVVFAGLTVLIALAALSVVRIPFLTSMGLAAAGTVLVAVLVALTLLPAVLGMLGRRAFGGMVRKPRTGLDDQGQVLNNGVRWARLIGRRPVAVVLVTVIALGALAVPFRNLQLALPSDSTAASDTTQRKASDLMSEAFGPGREGPLLVVVDARDLDPTQVPAALGTVTQWAAGLPDVANAQVVQTSADGLGAQLLVQPSSSPDDPATEELLTTMRAQQGEIEQASGTTLGVTGITAIQSDVSQKLSDALPIYLLIVVGLAFLLLMVVFRSILVPLTATLGFLLSVLATLGITVAVFQEGTFGLVEGAPLISFLPVFLVGIVFGLAMDYQVFLVTRMREAHVRGLSTRDAVVDGFRSSARVVTAAAAIMTAVFAAFVLIDDPIIKTMGFGLATAVVLDAFVVRMTLIPAVLYLLGEKAWWLPRWLDRLLPNVDVEGEALHAHGGQHVDPDAAETPLGTHAAPATGAHRADGTAAGDDELQQV